MIKKLLTEIERKFGVDMVHSAGLFSDGSVKTVTRGRAIFIRPEDWRKFYDKWIKKAGGDG